MNSMQTDSKTGKIHILYAFFSIVFLLYVSGNVFVMNEYATSVIALFMFQMAALFLGGGSSVKIDKKLIVFLALIMTLMGLSLLTNSFSDTSSYIAILLQMVSCIIICQRISFNRFKEIFVNIILFLAVVSLVFELISYIHPSVAYFFPKTKSDLINLNYYNAYIYIFREETGWGSNFLSYRNAGIFWEPGCYQAFLNVALFIVLSKKESKNKLFKAIILITTILSTFSVLGYIILALNLLFFKSKKKRAVFYKILLCVPIILIAGYLIIRDSSLASKIGTEYLGARISFDQIPKALTYSKIYFFGYTFTGRSGLFTTTLWNSIIDSCLVFGIPFVALLLYRYFVFCRKHAGLLFFIMLVLIFSTESLIWRPFFMCFLFYGFGQYRDDTAQTKEATDHA